MDPSHPFRLGGRFLKGRTLSHFVTRAAAAGVAVGTAAMVLVLSAFNGLEELVLATYKNVHPEVSLVHTEGARFELSKEMAERLSIKPKNPNQDIVFLFSCTLHQILS